MVFHGSHPKMGPLVKPCLISVMSREISVRCYPGPSDFAQALIESWSRFAKDEMDSSQREFGLGSTFILLTRIGVAIL